MRKIFLYGIGSIFFFYNCAAGQTPGTTVPIISVPDINGRAISLLKPAFPETAIAAAADGAGVTLRVVVDENGHVISAQCSLNCHPMLKDAAELAAATSKFRPLIKDGQAVKYQGVLLYTFVVERVDWFRFGTGLESARQFDNISVGPVAEVLSSRYSDEKARLLALDAKGVDYETRQKGISGVEALLNDKLKGDDLWRFGMGMALRRVTFWTMAGERTDRAELQRAINDLPRYIANAPEGVGEQTIVALTTVSKYKVPPDLPERDLRKAIYDMTRAIRIE